MTETTRLERTIFRNPLNKIVFSSSKAVYLVGGYLRDLVMHGVHSKDLDYAAGKNLSGLVKKVSAISGGTVVRLKQEHLLRVCLRDGTVLDFTALDRDIGKDLSGRDFTINALAWSPASGLIDRHGGLGDIKKGIIRAIAGDNLLSDPLRMLRAYRFSGELSFGIEPATRAFIRTHAGRLRMAARERITLEFIKLLNSGDSIKALKMALADGILGQIISLSRRELERNIKLISEVEGILKNLPERYHFKGRPQGLTYKGLLRLEGMLLDSKKHMLSLGKEVYKRAQKVTELYGKFDRPGRKHMFDLFEEASDSLNDILILSGKTTHLKDAERFRRIKGRGILSAYEIMAISGVSSGPKLGRIIREMKRLQFDGVLRHKSKARAWLIKYR